MKRLLSAAMAAGLATVVGGVALAQSAPSTTPDTNPQKKDTATPLVVTPENTSDTPAAAQEYYAVGPAAKALPAGILGYKLGVLWARGEKGFDKDGKKFTAMAKSFGYGANAEIGYGVRPGVTLGIKMGYTLAHELKVNDTGYSQAYEQGVQQMSAFAADGLVQMNPAAAAMKAQIQTNIEQAIRAGLTVQQVAQANGQDPALVLGLLKKAGIEAQPNDKLSDLVSKASRSKADQQAKDTEKRQGLEDIEVAAIVDVIDSDPFYFGTALGLHLPVGNYKDVPAPQATNGGGITDLIWRLNADYKVFNGVYLDVEDQMNTALAQAKRNKWARDPQTGEWISAKTSEWGVRHKGFVGVNVGLGVASQYLKALSINNKYKFELARYFAVKTEKDSKWQRSPRMTNTEYELGVGIDGLAYQIPAIVNAAWVWPLTGTNQDLAQQWPSVSIASFYKF